MIEWYILYSRQSKEEDILIEVRNLTKKYGDHTVVNHLNFTIESGKVYGFLGPNGAGKSTTMNMITGCLAPTEGQVLIDGHDIYDEAVEAKKSVGYLPEIPPVYPDMTPYEYLRFVAKAKGVKASEMTESVFSVMEETGLTEMRNRLIKNLSKGYRQRVGIAQAMLGNPSLIILDEPTVGLDPRQITEIRELIARLGQTRTIILSSHILAEVSAVCDHVMIINNGNLVASDTLENIRRDNTPDNRLLMTVRGNLEGINTLLSGMEGVRDFSVGKTVGNEDNVYDISIELEPDADISEKLFFAFANARYAVRRLTKDEPSLEEIFLSLTESAQDDDDAAPETDSADGDDDYSEEQADENDEKEPDDVKNDDYVPLFSKKEDDD